MPPQLRQPTTRLLMDFLISTFPEGGYQTNVPLGPLLHEAVQFMGGGGAILASRPWRPRADAIVFEKDRLVLIESKDLKWREGLTQLPYYRDLIPLTPELAPWRGEPVDLWLLMPWELPSAQAWAQTHNIEVKIHAPPWYAQRIADLNAYWTKEAVQAREFKKVLRERLGVP